MAERYHALLSADFAAMKFIATDSLSSGAKSLIVWS